jgi:hypothetical protein
MGQALLSMPDRGDIAHQTIGSNELGVSSSMCYFLLSPLNGDEATIVEATAPGRISNEANATAAIHSLWHTAPTYDLATATQVCVLLPTSFDSLFSESLILTSDHYRGLSDLDFK